MNLIKKILASICFLFGAIAICHLLGSQALAAEAEGGWRSNYDLIMMWVNFAIMVIVAIKFGKAPIKGYFRDQKENIARTIKDIEAQKEANIAHIQQTRQLMQESGARFEEIKEKIIAEGQRKQQDIVEAARRESQLMIENTNFWIDHQALKAKQRLKSELIDLALEQALQRLPQAFTPEDNQKYINHFLTGIDSLTK
jgi:F-type H+-transporting ATPase subunit b